jgi:RHH-type proline utilization regulon transcriptional repressor/proline dehydrogenase/delta 1-pyrroline-5-carboxylate dehydrogenase
MATIQTYSFAAEDECVEKLLNYIDISSHDGFSSIQTQVNDYIRYIRSTKISPIESFIHEYSLSNEEGTAIMCLAEALLRIPDKLTAR